MITYLLTALILGISAWLGFSEDRTETEMDK